MFVALKEFQDLCTDKIVLVATDNTTVVSYINKEGGMRLGPTLCPIVENLDLVHQGPDSRKVSSLSQISAEILLKSKILVSAEILLKLRFTKGISAETKISAKF